MTARSKRLDENIHQGHEDTRRFFSSCSFVIFVDKRICGSISGSTIITGDVNKGGA
jgi:hypothetical protein